MLKEKVFAEPRLVIFVSMAHPEEAQGFVITEKEILLHINNFSVIRGLIVLIAIYYVFDIRRISKINSCTRISPVYSRSAPGKKGQNC